MRREDYWEGREELADGRKKLESLSFVRQVSAEGEQSSQQSVVSVHGRSLKTGKKL